MVDVLAIPNPLPFLNFRKKFIPEFFIILFLILYCNRNLSVYLKIFSII